MGNRQASRQWLVTGCLLCVSIVYGSLQNEYGRMFQNEWTLWSHVTKRAPLKPRGWLNLSFALMERRRFDDAWLSVDRAALLLEQSHMRTWDKTDGDAALLRQRLVLSRVDPKNPR